MRIGIFIGVVGSSPTLEGLVQQAVDVETDGFDSFWTPQVAGVDALTLLALAGGRTERIELGTAVVPTYLRHPLALAQHALTTQVAADGRLAVGIGLSHKPMVEGRWGLSFDRPALHMREYLTVLRDLVREGRTRFDGEMFRVSGSIQVPGATPFPILIAALGPSMLRIAGELSQGTITWMVGLKTLRDHVAPRIVAAAEDAGRPEPRICVGLPIAVTDDPAAARQRAAGFFSRYGELPSYRRMLDIEGAGGPSDVAIVGGEEEVEERLREIADAGATDLLAVVFPADDDSEASVARTRALLRSLVGKM
jgi:5,10-methylenetetrahydromethanopterin reductase